MLPNEKTKEILIKHCSAYPDLQIRDIFKFIFQSTFGCEHMVSSDRAVTEFIATEYQSMTRKGNILIDELDGDYLRVHLSYLDNGLSADTLGRLFVLSAKKEKDGKDGLLRRIDVARNLIHEGILPFNKEEFEESVNQWQAAGFPPVHHSEKFRSNYAPSYRVIHKSLVTFLPLFARLDQMLSKGKVILAVEGSSASGKSTLGELLCEIYGCTLLHTDDFFLRPEQRTPERYAEIGGNLDRERFLEEVLTPLSKGLAINYRRFDCSSLEILPAVEIMPKALTVIEGAYSMHPELSEHYDLSAFLDISPDLQKSRIEKRNSPGMAKMFFEKWIPLERVYFDKMNVKERCDMVIEIK